MSLDNAQYATILTTFATSYVIDRSVTLRHRVVAKRYSFRRVVFDISDISHLCIDTALAFRTTILAAFRVLLCTCFAMSLRSVSRSRPPPKKPFRLYHTFLPLVGEKQTGIAALPPAFPHCRETPPQRRICAII